MEYVTVIIKPTHACNAACVYCSAWKESYDQKVMSRRTLERMYGWLAEGAEEGKLKGVTLTWHGGEPLLLPVSFYQKAKDLQESLLKSRKVEVNNIMQSNLLALNSRKAAFLSNFLVFDNGEPAPIGTSFDPIPGIRISQKGDYNQQFSQSFQLARDYRIPIGFIYTVHRRSLGHVSSILGFFNKRFPNIPVRFNPMYAEGRAKLPSSEKYHIEPDEWGHFLVALYREWEASGKRGRIDPFTALDAYHYHGNFKLSCEESGNCANTHLGINTDGTIFSCGRGVDHGMRPLGHIERQTFSEILESPFRLQRMNRTVYLRMSHCRGCGWWQYCHGGCPVDSEIISNHPFLPTYWCEGRKFFYEQVYRIPRQEDNEALREPRKG